MEISYTENTIYLAMRPDNSQRADFSFKRAFDIVFGAKVKNNRIVAPLSTVRSRAISRFCLTYRTMKYIVSSSQDHKNLIAVVKDMDFEANRFSLPWLTWQIRGLARLPIDSDPPRTFSRATAYDYAHTMIFLEALRLMDYHFTSSTVSSGAIGKIDDRAFILSPAIKHKLDCILCERGWTLSQFLDIAITREYEDCAANLKKASE